MNRAVMACVGLLMAIGCASPGPETVGELSVFDPADFEGKIFYIDQRISNAPLTAAELGPDVDQAIPVGLRVHENFVVAWHAPLGEPRVGDRDSVITAWRIHDTDELAGLEVETIANDDVAPGTDEEVVVQPPIYNIPSVTLDQEIQTNLPEDQLFQTPPQLQIYWLDEYRDAWIRFWTYHPDCA